jgi:hypothetical protein
LLTLALVAIGMRAYSRHLFGLSGPWIVEKTSKTERL